MAEKKYTRIVVEENNEHGFDSYRVPGIVTASNGDLLLTYEGRKDGGNMRRFLPICVCLQNRAAPLFQ